MTNVKRTFSREFLLGVLDKESEGAHIISDDLVDTSRWSTCYDLIFGYENKYYQSSYRVGATECQEESPWEYDGNDIECTQVHPIEVKHIVYKPVQIHES